ncbi:hypothetical protein KY284_035689 [Solanum tuberosum]|nr:hypothetical protein KY284_035689 [Solanum tuberosum]
MGIQRAIGLVVVLIWRSLVQTDEEEEEVVAAVVNPLGKCVMVMANIVSTYTFIDVNIAAKLGLKLTKSPSYIKTVNAKAQAIVGMAYKVSMSTENWIGKHNLMFVPFPHLDGMMIMNEGNAGFVKGVYPFGKVNKVAKKKDKGVLLSACQSTKG